MYQYVSFINCNAFIINSCSIYYINIGWQMYVEVVGTCYVPIRMLFLLVAICSCSARASYLYRRMGLNFFYNFDRFKRIRLNIVLQMIIYLFIIDFNWKLITYIGYTTVCTAHYPAPRWTKLYTRPQGPIPVSGLIFFYHNL